MSRFKKVLLVLALGTGFTLFCPTEFFGDSTKMKTKASNTIAYEGVRLSLVMSETEYTQSQHPFFVFTLQNISEKPKKGFVRTDPTKYGFKHPAYTPLLPIRIKLSGKEVSTRPSKTPAYTYKTVIEPGEKYTEITPFLEVVRNSTKLLPQGNYEVSTPDRIFTKFKVVEKPDRSVISTKGMAEAKLRELLQDPKTSPGARLRLLHDVYTSKRKQVFWKLITDCDDAFAVILMLEHLDGEWLDVEGLKKLCQSKDLAVRGAAMRAFSRLGKNEGAATWLAAFLATQKDELILREGKDALSVLKGTKKPNPVKLPPLL